MGPPIIQKILKEYPNSGLYLHSPLDSNAYKLSLLKTAPRISAIKIFKPKTIKVTEFQVQVLSACGSPNGIQRNFESGDKDTPDKVWEIQHTHKNVNGERVQLQQLVIEQQSEEIKHPMSRDEILSSVLSERSGYVRGKGYGKKPSKKTQLQQVNIEASLSFVMESIRLEMQADMDRKLQEERDQMTVD